jgi:peptide/nickel transport system substrate-binding protein
VRQAIAWAIDRTKVLQEVYLNFGIVTSVPWSPISPAWTRAAASHYSYNPTQAKALLQQAGATGVNIGLAIDSADPAGSAANQIIQSNLADVGINVQVTSYDNATYSSHLGNADFDGLFTEAHSWGACHPATVLFGAYPFRATGNAANFSSPEYTKLSTAVWTASTPAQAAAANRAVTQYLLDQQFIIDIVTYNVMDAAQSRFRGVAYSLIDYLNLDNAFLA